MLVVVLGGVHPSGQETYKANIVSVNLSVGILSLMTVALLLLIVRRIQTNLIIPRMPDTPGTVLSFLCGGKMLQDF